jgi:curli biogenesis system outer membrane secretion channel CsgG
MESAPPGAMVYFNGELAGKSPLYRTDPGFLTNLGYVLGGCHIRVVFPPEVLAGQPGAGNTPPAGSGAPGAAKDNVACDLRVINVADGSGIANASGEAAAGKLDALAKGLAAKLKEGMAVKGEAIAVISLRNRSGSTRGNVVVDELADKVQGALIDTGWFDVKERIDLRGVLNEQDLETAGIVRNENVRKKLAGVKYVVIGGVTVTEAAKGP